MEECQAVTLQFLQDEAFATEQTGAEFLGERDRDVDSARMNIIAPASANTASPGSSVMITACRSSPMI